MRLYIIFTNPPKFSTADIKCFTVRFFSYFRMAEAALESQCFGEDDETEHGTSAEYIDPWCDLCYDETGAMIQAYGFCPECNTFICKTCHGNHRKWPTLKNHNILLAGKMPKTQAEKPVKYPDCTKHAGNIKNHYCIDHRDMICSECLKSTHQICTTTPVSVLCQGLGSADIQQFETVVDSLKQNVLSTKSSLESNVADIEKQKQNLIKQAKEERDKIISKAGKLYENTVSMVSDTCEKKSARIAEQIMTLDNIIHSLDETNTDITKKLNVKFDQNGFIRMQQNVEKVREYKSDIENMNKEIRKITLSFSSSSKMLIVLSGSENLGVVKEISSQIDDPRLPPEIAFPQASSLLGKAGISKKGSNITQINVNKVSSLDIRLKKDKKTCFTRDMAVTSKGVLLISDWDNKSVKAFSQDNKLLSCLTFSDATYGISVINDQTAAVSTYDNKLHILNISDPANISINRSVFLEYLVTGVTQYKGNLIVTKFDEPQCVKMIDLNGKEKWSVSVDHNGQHLFAKPYAVIVSTCNDKSTVIVSDRGKHTLTLIDPNDGHLIKTIDVTGKWPHGVTCDNDGNIYACFKGSKEICVFSPDFEKSRILLSGSNLRGYPQDIVYCGNSDVFYISYYKNDTVECFQLA